eukprot:3149266-Rhodomonas_salina.1
MTVWFRDRDRDRDRDRGRGRVLAVVLVRSTCLGWFCMSGLAYAVGLCRHACLEGGLCSSGRDPDSLVCGVCKARAQPLSLCFVSSCFSHPLSLPNTHFVCHPTPRRT